MNVPYKLDTIIKGDESLCNACGSCVRACPRGLITLDQFPRSHSGLRGAPCIVKAYAPKDERTAPPAAMIAITYIQLATPALGLGTTFTGCINTASQSYPPLIEALGLPEGYIPYGTFIVGYPTEKYQRIPARKPVDVM